MLAIDVGNTHIKTAVFDGQTIRKIITTSTVACQSQGVFFALTPGLPDPLPKDVVVSTVREPIQEIMAREFLKVMGITPLFIGRDTPLGIENRYHTPDTLGIDRLVNAVAAYRLYREGARPLIVIDMGTATTIDYVAPDGTFTGGAIAPGMLSAYQGLRMSAPALPETDMGAAGPVVGRSTDECMFSGVVIAHAAMVTGMSRMMTGGDEPRMIVTGGISRFLEAWLPASAVVDRDLTLKGLKIIYELNALAPGKES